ncbi:hypothetical protein ILUMI_06915 [Ignelater luminosus]|uniref:CLIP domain-containing serine protease n=1 Tax=Ignelater luminosus TaxID=2038154 RepID=A0A8K0D8D3_IGNLU|nr:hypothetical protein ILUMI_06915 [Ignelater luminosus]
MSVKEVKIESSNLAMCRNAGTLKEFNTGEDWSLYKERLDQFFLAHYITEDRKVAVLLILIDKICKEAETTPVEETLKTALKKEATIREYSIVNKVGVRRKLATGDKEKINNSYKRQENYKEYQTELKLIEPEEYAEDREKYEQLYFDTHALYDSYLTNKAVSYRNLNTPTKLGLETAERVGFGSKKVAILFQSSPSATTWGRLAAIVSVVGTTFATLLVQLAHGVEEALCTTPSAATGTCVPRNKCQPVIDFIQRNSPLSQTDKEILHSYQCTVDNSAIVCCPDSPFAIPSSNNPDNELPPDVTNHKNKKLLPKECGLIAYRPRVPGDRYLYYKYPWMVLLNYRLAESGTDFRCDGTVINDWYILTAAHCLITSPTSHKYHCCAFIVYYSSAKAEAARRNFSETNQDLEKILTDNSNKLKVNNVDQSKINKLEAKTKKPPKDTTGQVRGLKKGSGIFGPHCYFWDREINSGQDNLYMKIDNYNVQPICLPTTEALRNPNLETTGDITVTSWQIIDRYNKSQKSFFFLEATAPVVSEEQCRKAHQQTPAVVTRKQICVNVDYFCRGNNGGPLQIGPSHNDGSSMGLYRLGRGLVDEVFLEFEQGWTTIWIGY